MSDFTVITQPIPMVLHCPNCHTQHIDAPARDSHAWCPVCKAPPAAPCYSSCTAWDNRPHRSHLCHACKVVWRPADVPTTGVAEIKTRGKDDTWPNINPVCGNCDTPVPPGCGGIFKDDGAACALFEPQGKLR